MPNPTKEVGRGGGTAYAFLGARSVSSPCDTVIRPGAGVRVLREFRRSERGLLFRAFVSIAAADLRLRYTTFAAVLSWADGGGPLRSGGGDDLQRARTYARWIDVAARHHPITARCLHRSLVLQRWLRAEGLASDLRIGVRVADGRFEAHAWVELGDEVMNDWPARVARFVPLSATARSGATSTGTRSMLRGARWQ